METTPTPHDELESAEVATDPAGPPRRPRSRYLIPGIVIVVVLVLLGGFGAGIFFARSSDADDSTVTNAVSPSSDPRFAEAMKFVTCMRGKGVPNYPDAQPNGELLLTNDSGVSITSKPYQDAEAACKQFLPSGVSQEGQPPADPGAQSAPPAQRPPDLTAYVKCIRDKGVTQFPDADALGNFSNVDPNWPGLQKAQAACAKHLPPGTPGAPK
ncbi:hypothetical protein Acy02nite_71070 [Actinoplanes cyaneus]|uniref:Uncharacterized protein n=1 Tax=Actinoplanes cyaneus TaxID=52696 RepID=A0A919IQ99_9ACTN|nr:hypothetical protein [Actinoplanes cyaneus]MCW2142209.1 hypothetical protein [Actinoplanes cyaneus]GID69226.1 hypothetical protein Acy02nite_71070 [Actinoplanes cyaneus]